MDDEQQRLETGIAALEGQRGVLGDAVVDAAVAGLRARLAELRTLARAAEPAQSLKQVTVLFLDVVGSTALGQHLDPEEIAAVMDGSLSRGTPLSKLTAARCCSTQATTCLPRLALTGRRRRCRARRALWPSAARAGARRCGAEVEATHSYAGFDVRVGIHTGGVLLGGGVDKDGSIRGQAVNIAARMEQTAPAGALRISHDTYRRCAACSTSMRRSRRSVKGVDAPVRSYLVLRAKARAFRGVDAALKASTPG